MAKKLYFKIGEACKRLDIQPYVLRYWETEFSMLSPEKSKSGQRTYNEQDLKVIKRIKELLYDEGYTIAGAKKKLEIEAGPEGNQETAEMSIEPAAEPALDTDAEKRIETLRDGIRDSLREAREIMALLERPQAID